MNYNVKVFALIAPKDLEMVLNDWLISHSGVHIEYITQSQVQHGQAMSMPVTVCIWYTEELP